MKTDGDRHQEDLELRVQKSLHRHGHENITAARVAERTIKLSGSSANAEDRTLAVALARTVPGVVTVICEIQLRD